ncbi:unnamed protein product, partial [Symbiodinium pilosum]
MADSADAGEAAEAAAQEGADLPSAKAVGSWDPSKVMDEIDSLRAQYKAQVDSNKVSPRLQFMYGFALACSSRYADVDEGIFLLSELMD